MRCANASAMIVGSSDRTRACLSRFLKSTCGMGTVSEVADGTRGANYLEQTRFDLVLLDRGVFSAFDRGLIPSEEAANGRIPIVVVTLLRKLAAFARQLEAPEPADEPEQLDNAALGELLHYARHGERRGESAEGVEPVDPARLHESMGHSQAIKGLVSEVEKVAPTDYSVMLVGETGTGKELVARTLHEASLRAGEQFVAIDSGAVSETLVESELFGHEEGAFTGAERARPGKFQLADGGTLLLDEISTMSANLQGTLLRALEQSRFYPVGGAEPVEVDTRVLSASNRDVQKLESFRDDLYYRLAEYVIEIPPLRRRREDIPHLARRFMQEANEELPHGVFEISTPALDRLRGHDWPGNVRELRNVVRQAALSASEGTIRAKHVEVEESAEAGGLSAGGHSEQEGGEPDEEEEFVLRGGLSLTELIQRQKTRVERRVLRQAMEETGGNMAETARMLGVDYKTVYKKVREYGLNPEE